MSDNYSDSFDDGSERVKTGGKNQDPIHQLKLSIDLLSVRNMLMASNLFVAYQLQLKEVHSFQSTPPTPVPQSKDQNIELKNCFASYSFNASKQQLFTLLNDNTLLVKVYHQIQNGQQSEIGVVNVPLQKILQAPLKQTPESLVRVLDDFLDIKDSHTGILKGNLRVLIYLEDAGIAKQNQGYSTGNQQLSLKQARELKNNQQSINSNGAIDVNPNPNQVNADYQAVWQIEMWKRAEEAKFKAYLKQKEIEKIEEITYQWKTKEQERELTFSDSLKQMETLDSKLRQKALDLQKREERIIQLEEELKHKITEVSRQLVNKEEEIIGIKKRFKDEKALLEHEKKKITSQLLEARNNLESAEKKFSLYKQEVENSPLSVLRNELAQKFIEIVELETKLKNANEKKDEFKEKYQTIQQQMIALKKQIEKEKEDQLTKQAQELEFIKKQMKQQQQQEQEKQEMAMLRNQLTQLQGKLTDTQRQDQAAMQQSQGNTGTNPFLTQKNRFIDNYAQQLSNQNPAGMGQSLNTPSYGAGLQSGNLGQNQLSAQKRASSMAPGVSTIKDKGPKGEIERLQLERQELVGTGCYTSDDPLIQELDRQIASIKAKLF